MKYSQFLTISAVIAFLFGLFFILVPAQVISLYGRTTDLPGQFMARYFGSALLGIAVLGWLVRKAPVSATRLAVTQGLFVVTALGFVVALYDSFSGGGNGLVWSNVVIYLLLAAGFGYFLYVKPQAA